MYSTTDGTNCWTDLHQIDTEDMFGPLLGRVGMSGSKIKHRGHQGQRTHCALTTPPQYGRNRMPSLQITSRKQQARRCDHWGGCLRRPAWMRALGLAGYHWALPRISSFFVFSVLAQRLAGKSISEMTYLCRVGCKTLTQSIRLHSRPCPYRLFLKFSFAICDELLLIVLGFL